VAQYYLSQWSKILNMNDPIVNERRIEHKADDLLSMEDLIKNHVKKIEELKIELRNESRNVRRFIQQ
jgi:anaerobic ribonucleoside-triphosphate reductase